MCLVKDSPITDSTWRQPIGNLFVPLGKEYCSRRNLKKHEKWSTKLSNNMKNGQILCSAVESFLDMVIS